MATIRQQERKKNSLFLLQRHNEKVTRNNGDYTTARKKPALSFFCKDTMRKSHGTMATIRQQERSQLSLPQRHNEKDTRNNGDYTTARKKPALSFFCKDTMRKSHGTMATIRQQERNQLSLSSAKTQRGRHTEQWRLYDSKKETSSLFLLQRHNEKVTRNNGDYTTARKKPALSFFCKDTTRKTHGTMATIRQL